MFVGTGSDVGKSVLNTGFCRIFFQDGYAPAPFKAQNMSLNSYATPDGLEIGRAQAVQAEACGIECSVEMNPVLLKPTGDQVSQVVLHGKPVGNRSASEYFLETDRRELFREAMSAYQKLDSRYNPIVIEGAGSISELNLRDRDITNMEVALKTGAATYLVADIDRGGVFGSVHGTIDLLPAKERDLIAGIIINKFRGDARLFEEGKSILEKLTGKPVVGMVPYFRDIFIEQEDSVIIRSGGSRRGFLNIGVVLLNHMSNFTDFNLFEFLPGVHLFYSHDPEEIRAADIVIIPGSKNTIADLLSLRESGMAEVVSKRHRSGTPVYGICGGYQMMGLEIRDPFQVEGAVEKVKGLEIFPVVTTLSREKKSVQCSFQFLDQTGKNEGYEIHMGETAAPDASPLCFIDGHGEGYFKNPRTWGSYIHGIFDNRSVAEYALRQIEPGYRVDTDYWKLKEENYDKLADLLRKSINIGAIYRELEKVQ